jgi:hypothetical protein
LLFTPSAGSLTLTVTGSVTNAQVEQGSFPTSYIPTDGTTVTRAADVAEITGTNFSSFYNQTEGAMFVKAFDVKGNVIAGTADTFDNTFYFSATTDRAFFRSGASPSASLAIPIPDTGEVKVAAAYRVNDFAAVSDGGTVATDALGAVPVNQLRLKIGSSPWTAGSSGSDINGHIKRLTYWPERLPDATLQTITT